MDMSTQHRALINKWKKQIRKVASDLERKIKAGFDEKKRVFALALAKLERRHAAQLTKSVAANGRKHQSVKKRRSTRKSK